MRLRHPRALAFAAAVLAIAVLGPAAGASVKTATSAPSYKLANVGPYGGEPTIAANSKGELYDTTPNGGTLLYKSTNHGATWTQATTADPSSGDDCVFTDQSNALYECNLAGSQSTGPLQADLWKSVDDGKTWLYGDNAVNILAGSNVCGTSCSPFGADRQWGAAYIPPGGTTNTATVVLSYHDFFGPSQIWVNISHNGGSTFGKPIDVLANLTTDGAAQGAVALADSVCNTVPTGAAIAQNGPHAGRIFVSWIASDPENPVTGCNVTMLQAFHNLFVSLVGRRRSDLDAPARLRRRRRPRHLDAVRLVHARQPG